MSAVEHKVGNGAAAQTNGTNGGALHQTNTNGAASDYTYKDGQMYNNGNSVSRCECPRASGHLPPLSSIASPVITPGGNPIDNSQPAFPVFHRKFANPAPLGLMAFGATTFVLSMFNVQARGITTPNVILGMALAYGGLCQLLAGMWEFAAGNTFGATAFSSYGGFWLSFAVLYSELGDLLDDSRKVDG